MPFDFSPELQRQILEAFQASQQPTPELPIPTEQESAIAFIRGLLNPQSEQQSQPLLRQPEVPPMPQVDPRALQEQPQQQSRERPTEYPTEPLSPNEEISKTVLHAAQQPRNTADDNRAPSIQLERTYQPPNPYEVLAGNSLINLKNYNELAADGGAGDALRQGTNNIANMIRDVASANGIDLSAYGSDVTAADAAKYHDSKRLRDIMEAISPEGQYYRTADQYYNDKVREAYFAGASPRQARKAASLLAQEYQARRVAYLRGVYGSYGHDANGTNDVGADTLGMLAQENPMLANYYAQIYPSPKDVITRRQTIEDRAQLHGYDKDNIITQYTANELGKNNDVYRDQIKHQFKNDSDAIQYYQKLGMDFEVFKGKQTFLQALSNAEPTVVDKYWKEGLAIAAYNGLTGDDAKRFAAQHVNSKLLSTNTNGAASGKGNGANGGVDTEKRITALNGTYKVLADRLEKLEGTAGAEQEVTDIKTQMGEIANEIRNLAGLTPQEITFTGDEAHDFELLDSLWQRVPSYPHFRDLVQQILADSMVSDEYLKKIEAYRDKRKPKHN